MFYLLVQQIECLAVCLPLLASLALLLSNDGISLNKLVSHRVQFALRALLKFLPLCNSIYMLSLFPEALYSTFCIYHYALIDGKVKFERMGKDRKKCSVYAEQ